MSPRVLVQISWHMGNRSEQQPCEWLAKARCFITYLLSYWTSNLFPWHAAGEMLPLLLSWRLRPVQDIEDDGFWEESRKLRKVFGLLVVSIGIPVFLPAKQPGGGWLLRFASFWLRSFGNCRSTGRARSLGFRPSSWDTTGDTTSGDRDSNRCTTPTTVFSVASSGAFAEWFLPAFSARARVGGREAKWTWSSGRRQGKWT